MLGSTFKVYLLIALSACYVGCATTPHREFEDVRIGMDKSTVLEMIGGPSKSARIEGRDRWIYTFRSRTGADQIREIHFDGGRVVYVGGRVAPNVPADEQDKANQALIREEDAKAAAAKRQWEINHNVARVGDHADPKDVDDLDLKMSDSLYGTTLYKKSEREKRKVAPSFTPVN